MGCSRGGSRCERLASVGGLKRRCGGEDEAVLEITEVVESTSTRVSNRIR